MLKIVLLVAIFGCILGLRSWVPFVSSFFSSDAGEAEADGRRLSAEIVRTENPGSEDKNSSSRRQPVETWHQNTMESSASPDGVHIFYNLDLRGSGDKFCTSVEASGVPDKASITLNFSGVDHKERLLSGFDHYAADIFLTLTAEGDCVQHGGFDYIESACRRTGDLGHKWWWRGDSSTYVASIRPTFGEPLMQAEKWEVCLGVGRNDSPHPYRIQGAIALHNVKSNEGELRRP